MDLKLEVLKRYLGTEDFEFLGAGCYACAYEYQGKVYKLTSDEDDFLMAKRLLKYSNRFPHFVKVFEAKKLSFTYYSGWDGTDVKSSFFLIVTEKVTPFSLTNGSILSQFWENLRRENNFFYNIREKKDLTIPKSVDQLNPSFASNLIEQAQSAMKMLRKAGYVRWDNHEDNFGLDATGTIKIFDFGCANKEKKRKVSVKAKLHYHLIKEKDGKEKIH